jgi:hypothetical protein
MTDQGRQYAAFIEAELKAEHDRRDSVNSRATSALTGSTGLVTLVLAIFAVFVGKDFTLTGWAKGFLVAALFALLLSACCAVFAGLAWRFEATSPETLQEMLGSHWTDSEVTAREITAYCNVVTLDSLHRGTEIKFNFLIAAGACQIAAVAALAACTLAVI